MVADRQPETVRVIWPPLSAECPVGRLWAVGPDTRTPAWFLVGWHLPGSRLVAHRVRGFDDPAEPPTLTQALAALGGRARRCGCRECRRPALVWTWTGDLAVAAAS